MFTDLIAPHIKPLSPTATGLAPKGIPPHPLGAVIFDIYGTLLISGSGDIGTANPVAPPMEPVAELLARTGIRHSPEKIQSVMTQTIIEAHEIRRNQGVAFPEIVIENIWQRIFRFSSATDAKRFALEYEMLVNPVYPMPGARALIDHCRGKGIPMGIVSNAQFFTPIILEYCFGDNIEALGFASELIALSFEHGCAKPAQALFDVLGPGLMQRGISPSSVLYVGNDIKKDVIPAKSAGFTAGLFAGDARSLKLYGHRPEDDAFPADLVIVDWQELNKALS